MSICFRRPSQITTAISRNFTGRSCIAKAPSTLLFPPPPSRLHRCPIFYPRNNMSTLPQRMRAVLVDDANKKEADALHIAETDVPSVKEGEVLVRVKAFGLNRMDILQRKGMYPLPPGASTIIGVEFSGQVESPAGEFKQGDEVFGLASGGAYAEYIAVNPKLLWSKPECLSWAEAAAIPENWLTAFQTAIQIGALQKGESILVHAGASGVGTSAIQLAKSFGAEAIYTTAGTAEKCKYLQSHLGATKAFNYKQDDWAQGILDLTDGKGVNLVLDFVGPDYWQSNIKACSADPRLTRIKSLIGLMSGQKTKEPIDLSAFLFKRLRVEGTTLRSRTIDYQSALMDRFAEEALPKIVGKRNGTHHEGMDLVIHKVYPAEQIVEATKCMEGAQNTGKLVMTW